MNVPQAIHNSSVAFGPSDSLSVWSVSVTSAGTNLTPGTQTFAAAGGVTWVGGAGAATWTAPVLSDGSNGIVCGPAQITNPGAYKPGNGPTASANAATVGVGSSNATWSLGVGILKLLYTAGSEGAIVTALTAVTNDGTGRTVTLLRRLADSDQYDPCGSLAVPASAGSDGSTAAADLLSEAKNPGLPVDATMKRIMKLAAGTRLYATIPTVSASSWWRINCTAEDMAALA